MRFLVRFPISFPVSAIAAGVCLGLAAAAAPRSARAQANGRVALEAKLQVFTGSGITWSGTAGTPPVTSYIINGTGLANINYTNSVSSGGITTGVVLEPTTGTGPTFNRAQTTLLFTPTITLTNTTSSFQPYQIQYDVSFGAFVNAVPNGGTALSAETVSVILSGTNTGTLSNFSQSLSRMDGFASDNNRPGSVGGTNGIAPFSSITLSLRTNISVDNQYTPAVAPTAAPEPATLSLLGMGIVTGMGMVRVVRQRKSSAKA